METKEEKSNPKPLDNNNMKIVLKLQFILLRMNIGIIENNFQLNYRGPSRQ